jgi:hypothetical protein
MKKVNHSFIPLLAFAALVGFSLACGSATPTIEKASVSILSTQTMAYITPSQTPIPSPLPSPSNTSEQPTSQPQPAVGIPGLTFPDVTFNLRERGFTCEDKFYELPGDLHKWICVRDDQTFLSTVIIYSRTFDTVDLIIADVDQYANPDDQIPILILGFIATMPYTGSTPDKARSWVETTIPTITQVSDHQIMEFGGVQYDLYGVGLLYRALEIGHDPLQ